jgi:hypothetical protein
MSRKPQKNDLRQRSHAATVLNLFSLLCGLDSPGQNNPADLGNLMADSSLINSDVADDFEDETTSIEKFIKRAHAGISSVMYVVRISDFVTQKNLNNLIFRFFS